MFVESILPMGYEQIYNRSHSNSVDLMFICTLEFKTSRLLKEVSK